MLLNDIVIVLFLDGRHSDINTISACSNMITKKGLDPFMKCEQAYLRQFTFEVWKIQGEKITMGFNP